MATERTTYPLPEIVDRAAWQAELDRLLVREKAHTREGDAIAAARRRLPMVEVDAQTPLVGADGPGATGRRVRGTQATARVLPHVARRQTRGGAVRGLHVLHRARAGAVVPAQPRRHVRDVLPGPVRGERALPRLHGLGDAVVLRARLARRVARRARVRRYGCYLRDGDRVFETYWSTSRGAEAGATSYHLLDLTVYGRQEQWEDSPEGWPQPIDPSAGDQFRTDGRPTSQWSRLAAGRSDDLSG